MPGPSNIAPNNVYQYPGLTPAPLMLTSRVINDMARWINVISDNIRSIQKTSDAPVIVNISGASASGKGFATNKLEAALKKRGQRVLVVSTDFYYKGISRMVTDKLPLDAVQRRTLARTIMAVTGQCAFTAKFSEENMIKLRRMTEKDVSMRYPSNIMELLKNALSHFDFDDPVAVDLPALKKDLRGLKKGGIASLPIYNMNTSEPFGYIVVNGKKYDVVLVEGIYALNDEVVKEADITTFIEAEDQTLLTRRLTRDVLLSRGTVPPETVLWMMLNVVLPGYVKHTLPDKQKAEIVLRNEYSTDEMNSTLEYDIQERLPLDAIPAQALDQIKQKPKGEVTQVDHYYLGHNAGPSPEHLLRVRVEDGRVKDMFHIGGAFADAGGMTIRPVEKFIQNGFGGKYVSMEQLGNSFAQAGFVLMATLKKKRSRYGCGNLDVSIDSVDGIGDFLELRAPKNGGAALIESFKKQFGITAVPSAGLYVDQYLRLASRPKDKD